MLKNSARNCARRFSDALNGMFFINEKSNDRIPGPIKIFRPAFPNKFAFPNEFTGAVTKSASFQKLPVVFGPLFGSPTRFGRSLPPPVLVLSPLQVGVTGRPD